MMPSAQNIILVIALYFCTSMVSGLNAQDLDDSMTQRFLKETGANQYEIRLANDNNDPSLPTNFRAWFYVKISDVDADGLTTIKITGRGHRHYYRPVYSLDGKTWSMLAAHEFEMLDSNDIVIRKSFASTTIYLARSEPYSFRRLKNYLADLGSNELIRVSHLGRTQAGYPIPMITITDFEVPEDQKRRVWIHARTHPGEVATSFVVEGLISELRENPKVAASLKSTVYSIVPMHNIDGVIKGNNRTTPKSENLEELWTFDPNTPSRLAKDSPKENLVLGSQLSTFQDGSSPINIMLNLHSTNGHPQFYPHFVPHFGPSSTQFSQEERGLFGKQKALADLWHQIMGFGSSSGAVASNPLFLKKSYPETWFWRQFRQKVLAVTFESTYGQLPGSQSYFVSEEHKRMGRGLAKAIVAYYDSTSH